LCKGKGHCSRQMATYCGHSNAPVEYTLKEEEVSGLAAAAGIISVPVVCWAI